MVDLSEPLQLWFTLETIISSLEGHIQHSLKSAKRNDDSNLEEILDKLAAARADENHPDIQKMKPFKLPLAIIGGKYDVYQEMEPEKKKIICRTLRFFAHYYGASLQFYR